MDTPTKGHRDSREAQREPSLSRHTTRRKTHDNDNTMDSPSQKKRTHDSNTCPHTWSSDEGESKDAYRGETQE